MLSTALRLSIFTLFPVLLAWFIILIDKSINSREHKLEIVLIFLFAIGVGGNGIFSFISHFFIPDIVADSIGWEAGSPFQLEIAFTNLALGALGIVATGRRDGFREATIIAVTVFAVGATIVHLIDIVKAGNLSPGNSIQNISNIVRPVLLISTLASLRSTKTKSLSKTEMDDFDKWRMPLVKCSAPLTISISSAYGLGFAFNKMWLSTFIGMGLGIVIVIFVLSKSSWHNLSLKSKNHE